MLDELQDAMRGLGMKHAIYAATFAGPNNKTCTTSIKDAILHGAPNQWHGTLIPSLSPIGGQFISMTIQIIADLGESECLRHRRAGVTATGHIQGDMMVQAIYQAGRCWPKTNNHQH